MPSMRDYKSSTTFREDLAHFGRRCMARIEVALAPPTVARPLDCKPVRGAARSNAIMAVGFFFVPDGAP